MRESDLWDDSVVCVKENEVINHSGHPLRMRTLVQLCWGWPRKASEMVVSWMRHTGASTLWIRRDEQAKQQREAFRAMPSLIDVLCDGLAGRISRESRTFTSPISGVVVEFDKDIADEGLTTAVMRAIAARLGCTLDELRAASHFSSEDGIKEQMVYVSKFNP